MSDSDFDDVFEKAIGSASTAKRKKMILLQVVIPVAIALLGISTPSLYAFSPWIPVGAWLFLSIVYVLLYLSDFPDYDDIFSLIHKIKKKKDIINRQDETLLMQRNLIKDLYIKNIAAFAMRSMSI